MLRLLADENFKGAIVRGVKLRRSSIDMLRVQDVGLRQHSDEQILAWASANHRIVRTHDRSTMPDVAFRRITNGERMPGLFVVDVHCSIGETIAELLLIDECSETAEWLSRVVYLPL